MASFPNTWHLRTVAENASKPCWIDYKSTTAVLITPDNKDFFYICKGHLKDRTFATAVAPVDDADAKTKKREEDLRREIEAIKAEYAEKQAKKSKAKDKSKDDKKVAEEDKKDEQEKEDKIKAAKEKSDVEPETSPELPRIWSLHRNFYQMRLDRIRKAEIARRNRERLQDPNAFPSVPSSNPL